MDRDSQLAEARFAIQYEKLVDALEYEKFSSA